MKLFSKYKIEWIIGISCAFIPSLLLRFISFTESMPEITIPFWLLCILITAPMGYFAAKQYGKKVKDVANKSFSVEKENADGNHYSNCKFDGTELIFSGTKNFSLSGNHFVTTPRVSFDGYASTTMIQLIAMYSEPGFRPFVDATLENIKEQGLEIEHNKSPKK